MPDGYKALPLSTNQARQASTIISHVAEACGLSRDDFHLRTRKREFSQPRFVAAFLLRGMTTLSLAQMARVLAGEGNPPFHHSNVNHGIKKTRALLQESPAFHKQFTALAKRINEALKSEVKTPQLLFP
jgi:chromosomal replication initiation ATPase DnaA